ncbi:prolipoprotein diacylglyceryl transferase [bacterium]|nr:prolipoprotein diacylglyceryl transferase [bacterium]MCB1220922.1 prolipoprotein diacylglyceryl transferase [bacterium]UNM07637.1 MAG: prolipoprotein diacylglyceryl transferase [Planctomycetales bacterium]
MDPIAFAITDNLQIRWYGIMMAISMLLGSYIGAQLLKKIGRPGDLIWDGLVWIILAGISGARLVYVLTNISDFVAHPEEILRVDHGGLSFHGGIIAGVIAAYFYFRRHKINFIEVMDSFAPGVAIGVILVRIGNFMNGDILGFKWDGPWAMNFPYDEYHRMPGASQEDIILRHPTELYGLLVGVITFFVCYVVWRKIYIDKVLPRGANYITFVFCYSLLRTTIEDPFRHVSEQHRIPLFGSITLTYSQIVDIVLILVCIWAYTQLRKWDAARREVENRGSGFGGAESRQERRARQRAEKSKP